VSFYADLVDTIPRARREPSPVFLTVLRAVADLDYAYTAQILERAKLERRNGRRQLDRAVRLGLIYREREIGERWELKRAQRTYYGITEGGRRLLEDHGTGGVA
jgi:hypothetical protein